MSAESTPPCDPALAYLDDLQSYATFVTSLTIGNLLITGRPSIVGGDDELTLWSKHSHDIDEAQAQLSLAARGDLLTLAGEGQADAPVQHRGPARPGNSGTEGHHTEEERS